MTLNPTHQLEPRALHPGAWWLWAIGLAVAVSRTTSLVLLALVVVVAAYVVAARRTSAPWARSFHSALIVGAFVVVIRLAFEVVFGVDAAPNPLVTLPEVPVPGWAAGLSIGGAVTADGLRVALREGVQIAALIACMGAANALANPSRLLKAVPGALYEVGLAVVVGLSLIPQAVEDVQRIRRAHRLRGRTDRGPAALASIGMAALEGALHRSLLLAGSMDDRGYGRTAAVSVGARRLTAALLLGGLMGLVMGLYGLLDSGSPGLLGVPLVLLGAAAAVAGFALSGRRSIRTRYRPDPWRAPEWITTLAGAVPAVTLILLGSRAGPAESAPVVALLAILTGLLPAWVTPIQEVRLPPDVPRSARTAAAASAPMGVAR